jgi:hypothetical protein
MSGFRKCCWLMVPELLSLWIHITLMARTCFPWAVLDNDWWRLGYRCGPIPGRCRTPLLGILTWASPIGLSVVCGSFDLLLTSLLSTQVKVALLSNGSLIFPFIPIVFFTNFLHIFAFLEFNLPETLTNTWSAYTKALKDVPLKVRQNLDLTWDLWN